MSKKYTLEVTAEELKNHEFLIGVGSPAIYKRLHALAQTARADREADELRLPWRVGRLFGHPTFEARVEPGDAMMPIYNERQLKLMSAAPELLEAVSAAVGNGCGGEVRNLCLRALRKVETGQPEDK